MIGRSSSACPPAISIAFVLFLAFYVTCVTLTWWHYTRRRFRIGQAPNLSAAGV